MKRIILTVFIIFVLALISNGINQYDENKIKYPEKSKIEIKKLDYKEKNHISLKGGSAGRAIGKIGTGKSSSGKGSGSTNKVPPKISESRDSSKPLTSTKIPRYYNDKFTPKVYRPVIRNNVDTEINNFRTINPFYSIYPRWTYYFNPPYMRHYNNTKSITEEEQWKDQ